MPPLPANVQRGAAKAAELMREQAQRGQPAATLVAQPAPAAAPQPAPLPAGETVESLKAKLAAAEAEVARLNTSTSMMGGRASTAERKAAEAAKELAAAKARTTELEAQLKRKVEAGEVNLTDIERDVAGRETVPVMVKIAREVLAGELDMRLAPLTKQVNEFGQLSEQQYQAQLDLELPDFDEQNKDLKFISWLQGLDPTTGRTRRELLTEADAGLRAFSVIEIFRAFKEKREIGVRTPPKPDPLLAPPAGGGAELPPVEPNTGKTYSRADIRQFYRDKNNRSIYSAEQARALESDIFLAQSQGRVR